MDHDRDARRLEIASHGAEPTSFTARRTGHAGLERIKPSSIRAGDRFASRLRVRPAMLRRARSQRVPALRAGTLRLTARASALSNEELTRLLLSLQSQLAALSLRMDALAAKNAADTAALQAQINALAARVTALGRPDAGPRTGGQPPCSR